MANYLVTPVHKNGYTAPSILCIGSPGEKEAVELAESKSSLSKSKKWYFNRYIKKVYPKSLNGKDI